MQTMESSEHSQPHTSLNTTELSAKLRPNKLEHSILPETHLPYTDRYFLNSSQILKAEGLNPWVRAQIVIRKGPGTVEGIDQVLEILGKYSKLAEHGGVVKALKDGDHFEAGEALITIEGPIQDFIELETMYLGVLSAATSHATDGVEKIDLVEVENRMRKVADVADGRPIIYMGARHWRFSEDEAISRAAFIGGATYCSTQVGAETVGQQAVGTIPHVLENIMAFYHGKDRAVVEASKAFDRQISANAPRTALIDYNNHEIDDALATARELGGRLSAVRVDTCGENVAQGALLSGNSAQALELRRTISPLVPLDDQAQAKYWYGHGVTVSGVYALRKALNEAGFSEVKIVLSSGFADPKKVQAFIEAEQILGVRLVDSFGVGGVFSARHAKTDIVAVGETPDSLVPISKAGRQERKSERLQRRAIPSFNE